MPDPVAFIEMQGSPSEGRDNRGQFTATRRLYCAWGDRDALMRELLDKDYPLIEDTHAICVGATSDPVDARQLGEGDEAAYEKALVTVEYKVLPSGTLPPEVEIINGKPMTEGIEPVTEFLTQDYTQYCWALGEPIVELRENEAPGRLIKGLTYVRTRYLVTNIPMAVLNLMGSVNSDASIKPKVAGLTDLNFTTETLLYVPPTLERVVHEGEKKWTVTMRFPYKPNWDGAIAKGWNYFYHAKTKLWTRLALKSAPGDGINLYTPKSFVGLFTL